MIQRNRFCLLILVVLLTTSSLSMAQEKEGNLGSDPENYVAFAQSIYWQALTPDEKQTFLFAYIASAYEVRKLANEMIQVEARRAHRFNERIDWFFNVWQDILAMEDRNDGSIQEFIGWIDLYYQIDFNRTQPFHEALAYAHDKMTSGDKELLYRFWGAEPDTSGPRTDAEFEQQSIQRRIATAEAHRSIDSAAELSPADGAHNPQSALDFTAEELRIIDLAVETECLNKNDPERLDDLVFLEELAQQFGFASMADFNARFGLAQEDPVRWDSINKAIIEKSFDKDCM